MNAPLFRTHVIVDWSARATPSPARPGHDAIWIGICRDGDSAEPEYHRTRAGAVQRLADLLSEELAAGRRVLVGFDFPFGYPEGVAQRLTGRAEAVAVWDWLAAAVQDGPDNANNRFAVAEAINRHYDGIGPCWGRPATWHHPDLPETARERHGADHPPPRRRADARARAEAGARAHSVWQMAYAGSVGSQALLGIAALGRLRADRRLAGRICAWPIERGLADPGTPVVLAEVYPSLIARAIEARRAPGEIKDRAQVRVLSAALSALDARGGLDELLRGPADLTAGDRQIIEREESWMLGLGQIGRLETALDAVMPVAPDVSRPGATPRRAAASQSGDGPVLRGAAPLRYMRDPAEIYRLSFDTVRAESRLDHLPDALTEVAVRLVHACGMPEITARLAWSEDVAPVARAALRGGAPVLCDCQAVASMVIRDRLPAANEVVCTLGDAAVPGLARDLGNTRSAAAVELWRDRLDGAVVAIGNAPTALFHLLELLDAGWPRPAAILGFPVGFVGAAESKAELAARPRGVPFLTLRGRRGGSAMAAAAVNALAGEP